MATEKHIEGFEVIDLDKFTLADLGEIKNPALRNALLDAVLTPGGDVAVGHQNHGSHGDHTTDSSRFIEMEFLAKKGRDVGQAKGA